MTLPNPLMLPAIPCGISSPDRFLAPVWYPQQTSWIRQPFSPGNAAYNYALSFRIYGSLDREALLKSFECLTLRHEIFRSVFQLDGNNLIQIVGPPKPFFLCEFDIAKTEPDHREARAISLAVVEANRPFDLAREPALRVVLIRVATEDHIILVVTHHIACDDWSVGILLRELSLLYGTYSRSDVSLNPLPALSYSYRQFVQQLSQRMTTPEMQSQIQFWGKRLLRAGDFHHLSPDRARPVLQTFAGAHEVATLLPSLVNRIKRLGQAEQVSTFMVLLGALQCLLMRHSGQHDIGVATCVANRDSTETDTVVGPLSNQVILHTDLSGNPSPREILDRVRAIALDAYSNQGVPFGTIVNSIGPPADPSRNPLFQTLLVFQHAPKKPWMLGNLEAEPFAFNTGTTRYDLNVWLRSQSDEGLEVDFQYNSNLFHASTIRAHVEDYCSVLESFVDNSEEQIHRPRSPGVRVTLPATGTKFPKPPLDQNGLEDQLQKIWQELLGLPFVDTSADFFELGGDSLRAVRLISRVEKVYRARIPLSTILEARTIRRLAHVLRYKASNPPASCLVALKPFGAKPPLFCIHNHTGDVLFCRSLPKYTDFDQPVYGIQSRALVGEPPQFSVEQIAADYVAALEGVQRSDPCLLFGYSFGGLVAFEMAQLLLARGRNVAFLGMFNTPAPGSLSGWPLRQLSYIRERTRNELAKLPQFSGKKKLAHLARNATNFGGMLLRSAATDAWRLSAAFLEKRTMERLSQFVLRLDQINILAAKNYLPKRAFPGKITFFQSQGVPYLYPISPQAGWAPFASEGFEIVKVPDDNPETAEEQFARTVAAKVSLCLLQQA